MFVHLVGLCAVLEEGMYAPSAARVLVAVVRQREDFPVLRRSRGPGELTLLHVRGAHDLRDYERRATEWAGAVWRAWTDHHGVIRDALTAATRR